MMEGKAIDRRIDHTSPKAIGAALQGSNAAQGGRFGNPAILKFITGFLLGLAIAVAWQLFDGIQAHARDMQGRLGLGYNAQFSNASATNGTPGVSVRYGVTPALTANLIVGVRTSDPSNSVTALKFTRTIFPEKNLNFYFLAAAGLITYDGNSGGEFMGGFGTEFFIPGIESLGFAVETGIAIATIGDGLTINTMGIDLLQAGVHFYF